MGTGAFARACRPFRACIPSFSGDFDGTPLLKTGGVPAFSAIFDGIASQRTGRAGQAGLRLRERLAEPAGKGDAAQLGVLAARFSPDPLRGSRVPLPSNLLGQCSHFSALSSPLRLARGALLRAALTLRARSALHACSPPSPWPPPSLVSRPACPVLPARTAFPAITPRSGRLRFGPKSWLTPA